jgi:hypothetical protein
MTVYTDDDVIHLRKARSVGAAFIPPDTLSYEDKACRALWLAVIHQALLDLVNENTDELLHGEVRRWFFMQSDNFNFVCAMAAIDPKVMRERARAIETNPELLGNPHV